MATVDGSTVKKIVVACDAGMGSSVMLASTVRRQLRSHGVEVVHTPVNDIPGDADVVLTHAGLAERARRSAPGVPVVPFRVFIGDPAVTRVVDAVKKGGTFDA